MFKKLLSNLPFNPSLIQEVSFYARRLHRETALRRSGVILLVLAMLVQMFAVVSPPQQTLAASGNDIIHGGFANRDVATVMCRDSKRDFATILAHFQITCDQVANATPMPLSSRDHNSQLYSLGRWSYGPVIKGKASDEHAVKIGSTNFFARYLWAWDSGPFSKYQALRVTNSAGQTMYILNDCGNVVTIGRYSPPVPKPTPQPAPQPAPKPEPKPKITPIIKPKPRPPTEPVTPVITIDKCPEMPGEQPDTADCKPCDESTNDADVNACLEYAKAARNNTQNITDANNTTAAVGDIITYTLLVTNHAKVAANNFVIQESLGDVMEYTEKVVDTNGGTINDRQVISWPAVRIDPGETVSRTVTIQLVKDIPDTPRPSSNPGSYDLMLTNVYGNAINIKLPGSVAKTVETTAATLPNTGPGTTVMLAALITAGASYFYARSRLMAKEIDIIRDDFAAAGGV